MNPITLFEKQLDCRVVAELRSQTGMVVGKNEARNMNGILQCAFDVSELDE